MTTTTAEFFDAMWTYFVKEARWEMDHSDFCAIAERLGLIETVRYDPEVHGPDDEAEPGDPYYWVLGARGREAVALARGTNPLPHPGAETR